MQRKSGRTLIPNAHLKTMSLTIRMPSDIMERMQRVKDDADALGYTFDAQKILVSAMIQGLNRAESELEKLLNQTP